MLLGLLLLTCSITIETGPPRSLDAAPDRSPEPLAASATPEADRRDGSLPADRLSQRDQLSPWDDEIEFPDDSEDEEPEDSGEALNSKPPARNHFKACSCSGPIDFADAGLNFAIALSPRPFGSSRSPAALCRLLF